MMKLRTSLNGQVTIDELLDQGSKWIDRGKPVIPCNDKVPCGKRGRPLNDWQNVPVTVERLEAGLHGAGLHGSTRPMIGMKLGPSSSIIDIETDGPDEDEAVRYLFRDCESIETVAYKSKRGRHSWFKYDPRLEPIDLATFHYETPSGQSVGIRLGLGDKASQSIIPPSTDREWLPGLSFDEHDVEPLPEVVIERLLEQAGTNVALTTGKAKGGRISKGGRNTRLASLAGTMRNRDMSQSSITAALLEDNAERCNPPLPEQEVLSIAKSISGYPPGELVGNTIILSGDLEQDTAAAWEKIGEANKPTQLFRHGSTACRIELDDEGRTIIHALNLDRMRHHLARVTKWGQLAAKGMKPVRPPDVVVRDVLATPNMNLPILNRVVGAPVFAADGSLEVAVGYHPKSRVYYEPAADFKLPKIPQRPTRNHIVMARECLLDNLLVDFPFVSDSERAVAVALMLLSFARELIDGSTPLHLFEKPIPGTGATLLVDTLTYPAMGAPVPTMTEGRDEDEWRKRITAKLITGPSCIFIDNLKRRLDSASVSSAITSQLWEDRILGHSEMVNIPVRCGWIASGNNPVVSSEIARRTVRCRLDAKLDRPWLRQDFKHKDLRGWARKHRGQLVRACLTLIRAWIVAGKPKPKGVVPLGMFESWSETMGGILAHAGIGGFLENADDFYDQSDEEGKQWRCLVSAWHKSYTNSKVAAGDLFLLAENAGFDLEGSTEHAQKIRFGKMLSRMRDRRFTVGKKPFVIQEAGTHSHKKLWRLKQVSGGGVL